MTTQDVPTVIGEGWVARLYQPEIDKAGLQKLSEFHYGTRDQAHTEFIDWFSGTSPAGHATVVVGEDTTSHEIIGFCFYMPVAAKVGDDYGVARMGGNAVVHPDYRMKGVFRSLQQVGKTSLGNIWFSYGFPKPSAVEVHKRGGRVKVSDLPLLVRPVDMGQLAEARLKNPLLRAAARAGWWLAGRTIWRQPRPAPQGITVRPEETFDASFDRFWERVAGKYEIIIKRDSAFLNWRFCATPFRQYRLLTARGRDGELAGYLVLRCTTIEGVKTGLIMDLLVAPGERGDRAGLLLVAAATRQFAEAGMALAGCLMLPHTHEYRLLTRAGYLNAPARFAPQRFMLLSQSFSDRTPSEYLTRAERWFISMANHDAV
ncbi:MAG TPA: hypothetical protein VFF68_02280 [Anaerolineaceae bacterium]|nr:hypothetical protein [Anaerolineaceae bacterium]